MQITDVFDVVKEGKRLVKVMKEEAKAAAKAVEVAMKDLTDIQRMQKNAIKVSSAPVFLDVVLIISYRRKQNQISPTRRHCVSSTRKNSSTSRRARSTNVHRPTCRRTKMRARQHATTRVKQPRCFRRRTARLSGSGRKRRLTM